MDRFEYRVDTKHCRNEFDRNSLEERKYLEINGVLGWELVSVSIDRMMTFDEKSIYYWKKKIT